MQQGDPQRLFIHGSFCHWTWCGWCQRRLQPLFDADGDGIYTAIIEGLADTVEYKYGIDGFADQEQLVDDIIAERLHLSLILQATPTVGTRRKQRTTYSPDLGEDQAPQVNVTFRVDMSQYTETYGTERNGSFNGGAEHVLRCLTKTVKHYVGLP